MYLAVSELQPPLGSKCLVLEEYWHFNLDVLIKYLTINAAWRTFRSPITSLGVVISHLLLSGRRTIISKIDNK